MKSKHINALVIGDFEVEGQLFSTCLRQFIREVIICGTDLDEVRPRIKNRYFDLVFVDFESMRNPDMLLTLLKYKWTTVIFPEHDSVTISRVLEAGADDFLVRPLTSMMIAKRLVVWGELIDAGTFAPMFSHEVKGPLTSIQGFTELLLSEMAGSLNVQQKNFLNTIRASVKRQYKIIDNLIQKVKVENPKFLLRVGAESANLRRVIISLVEQLKTQSDYKDRPFELLIPDDLASVAIDEYSLECVLMALLENANQYTLENGEIVLSAENITEGGKPFVRVSIKDRGIGIDREDQPHIFQEWFRAEKARSLVLHGYGLGLYLTKRLLEAYEGHIWFDSHPGEGTTFHFTVPAAVS